MPRRDWTREELLVAFNLYCKIPFGQIHIRNRLIIDLAEAIRRTPSVWNEFNHNWEALAFESERPLRNMTGDSSSAVDEATEFPEGRIRETLVRTRINQSFFRASVLAAYGMRCCITGLSIAHGRSIGEFVTEVEKEAERGLREFDPRDRLSGRLSVRLGTPTDGR